MNNILERRKSFFEFMPKHPTYSYLKNCYIKGKRIVVSRYGDGEYYIILGQKKRVAKQNVSEELIKLLNYSVRTKGQLICLPAKKKITLTNLNESENIKFSDVLSRYIISITDHNLYGQGQWRMVDLLRNNSNFITNFFLDKTLVVTGHKEATECAFRKIRQVEVYETPVYNATSEYKTISKDLASICEGFKNIIFGCGPLSKILVADLISRCDSNLVDLGSIISIIVNPFSPDIPVVNRWSGFGKNGDPKKVEECSINFFETLRKKL